MSSAVILIPARYQSSRFPGKPLAPIKGQSMIERVYKNAAQSGFPCYVVTDDERIEKAVKAFGGKCLRVDDDVVSGSERIALAYERFLSQDRVDFVVNVQGDEPLLKGDVLKNLVDFHAKRQDDITTLVRPRSRQEADWSNPNVVKAVKTEDGKCLYFSRSQVPFERDGSASGWLQHVGVYCYRPKALLAFVKLPMSRLEDLEKLEQLRAMDNGMSIGALETKVVLMGVDTPEDVQRVEALLE